LTSCDCWPGTTGGNPFFVTEVLAAGRDDIPATVRDAVLARVARLDPRARTVVEVVAVAPWEMEAWLLDALAGDAADRLDECLAAGILVPRPGAVAFRHELARIAVEESLPPNLRVALHAKALATLATQASGTPDAARLAHHAEEASDEHSVLRFAPRPRSRRRPWVRIARRRPSMRERFGSTGAWRSRTGPTYSSAERTSAS